MGDLWAITSYYNPLGYKRRRANYRIFRQRLGVPLITVELAFGTAPFQLSEGDADILIQRRGGDVMWQKERLLNIALDALPEDCTKVAWIDCDVVFQEQDWPERASQLLEHVPIAQLFSRMHQMSSHADHLDGREALDSRPSLGAATDARATLRSSVGHTRFSNHMGLAWCGRRDLLERHGFYDACIVGSGDWAMAGAAYGCADTAVRQQQMTAAQAAHYLAWAAPFHDAVQGAVGCVDGELFHLWHGARENRRYRDRHVPVAAFGFDPVADLAFTGDGLWRWASDKPALHEHVREHFAHRREDG